MLFSNIFPEQICVGANIFAFYMFVRYRVVARSNILPIHSCHWEGGWALGNLRFFMRFHFLRRGFIFCPRIALSQACLYLGLLPVLGLLRGGVEHGGHGGAVDNRDGEISGGSSSTEWVVGALGSAQAWARF